MGVRRLEIHDLARSQSADTTGSKLRTAAAFPLLFRKLDILAHCWRETSVFATVVLAHVLEHKLFSAALRHVRNVQQYADLL